MSCSTLLQEVEACTDCHWLRGQLQMSLRLCALSRRIPALVRCLLIALAFTVLLTGHLSRGELIHLSRSFGRHIWFHVASCCVLLKSQNRKLTPFQQPNQVEEAPLHEPIPDK